MIELCGLFLLFSFLWPFIGGWREMVTPSDSQPLFINMDYLKDPRYFAHSFRHFFARAFMGAQVKNGEQIVELSRPEHMEVVHNGVIEANSFIDEVYYATDSLTVGADSTLAKEVYARGDVSLGSGSVCRALASDGVVSLGSGTAILRWLDAEEGIKAGSGCNLGVSATSGKQLSLSGGCVFRRLYGFPVRVGERAELREPDIDDVRFAFQEEARDIKEIAAGSQNWFSVITINQLTIGAGATVYGSVKSHKSVLVEAGATVTGDIFAEGDVELQAGSRVLGTVFCQDKVILGPDAVVGQAGHIRSVIGNRSVLLHDGAAVYGFISTDGEGSVA